MGDATSEAINKLVKGGLAKPEEICGCSAAEIAEIEAASGHAAQLPAQYRSFLREMGRSAGHFLRGTDVFYPQILKLRNIALALLRECAVGWSLGSHDFVFSSHQGYQFLFFDWSRGDDPPVMLFLEGDTEPRQVFASFSEWLRQSVRDELGET